MTYTTGPCSAWTTRARVYEFSRGGTGRSVIENTPRNDTVIDEVIDAVSDLLYVRTGRQFTGDCETTLRPCCTASLGDYPTDWWATWGYPYRPTLVAGEWYNVGPGGCACVAYDCGGSTAGVLNLGFHPVTAVTQVRVDGAVLAPSAYRLDRYQYLRRVDGNLWPTGQDLDLADTAAGTWSVTFTHGRTVPPSCALAADELACELARSIVGVQCTLPKSVTAISRQGITYQIASVADLIERGSTGLYWVDLAVSTHNPQRLARRGRVVSPDVGGRRGRIGSP